MKWSSITLFPFALGLFSHAHATLTAVAINIPGGTASQPTAHSAGPAGRAIDGNLDQSSPDGLQGVLSIGKLQVSGGVPEVNFPLGTDLTRAGILTMTTTQSSTLNIIFASNLAVDGDLGSTTHTHRSQTPASWQVDFGEMMSLEQVMMSTRMGCCGGRLRDITVSVLNGGGGTVFTSELLNPENALGFGGGGGGQIGLDLSAFNGGDPVNGQTVVITRTPDPDHSGTGPSDAPTTDDSNVLSLAEVTVIGGSLVPEPSSAALLSLAGLALLGRRRR